MLNMPNRSDLFRAYHILRKKLGVMNSDMGRLNRALGIAQSDDLFRAKLSKYNTDTVWCGCPDAIYRSKTCKHILALLMREIAWDMMYRKEAAVLQPLYELFEVKK